MSGAGKRALDVGVHLAGVLCLLAGCFAFLTAPFVLRTAWLAYDAPRYREAIFVVERVDRTPPGRRTSGSYELQGLAGGQVERYQPGRQGYSAGQQIPVMHNPTARFRDLRVVDSERDFVKNQRSRARARILRIYGPLISLAIIVIALMLWRRRIHGVPPVWMYVWAAAWTTLLGLAGGLALRHVFFRS